MPTFLTKDRIYRILQRELPEGVYPDGPASAFFSTADMGSVAAPLETAYSNLSRIYDNFFPQYADEKQTDWERTVFGAQLDASLTLAQRRSRVISQIRSQRRTTKADMLAAVYTVIDSSIKAEIVEWGNGDAGWMLDVSQLDISTNLNGWNHLEKPGGTNLCGLGASDLGMSASDWDAYQREAYQYEVRIYDYTLTDTERSTMDATLNTAEPARSAHLIVDGLPSADMLTGSN